MSKKKSWLESLDDDDGFDSAAVVEDKPKAQTYARCFESHKPLIIDASKSLQIFGGSCSQPVVKDADIYIGFDMSMPRTDRRMYPWEKGEHFLYVINDMQAPKDSESFVKLIDWVAVQLIAGKKIHAGCIGGHGRTGTFLSALYNVMTGEKDSTTFVRENYCKKAVESDEQIKFLSKHFGIKEVEGTKASYGNWAAPVTGKHNFPAPPTKSVSGGKWSKSNYPKAGAFELKGKSPKAETISPAMSISCLFGSNLELTN